VIALLPIDLVMLGDAERAYVAPTISSDLAHALVVEDATSIRISFKGTNNIRDDLTDADAESTDLAGFSVDAGFFASATSIAWRLIPLVLTAVAAGKMIYIGGHSKGGAEAQIFVLMLILLGIAVERLVVFEPARALGTAALTAIAAVPSIATRNGCDDVPSLPPRFGSLPLLQLGSTAFRIERLVADHLLVNVRPAFEVVYNSLPTVPAKGV